MKHEWKKNEKHIYLPPAKPVIVEVPSYNYFCLAGSGNPNSVFFEQCIEALYAVSYAVRMSYKKGLEPPNFYEYTVYPLEGRWDIPDQAKNSATGVIDKDQLVFTLMIRQPEFVFPVFAQQAKEWAQKKKNNPLITQIQFTQCTEGKCVQMMHVGSYDTEQESFAIMEAFCQKNGLQRKSRQHKEIYIADPRKTAPEKLRTVLRIAVE